MVNCAAFCQNLSLVKDVLEIDKLNFNYNEIAIESVKRTDNYDVINYLIDKYQNLLNYDNIINEAAKTGKIFDEGFLNRYSLSAINTLGNNSDYEGFERMSAKNMAEKNFIEYVLHLKRKMQLRHWKDF
jgi:hypothetical protein